MARPARAEGAIALLGVVVILEVGLTFIGPLIPQIQREFGLSSSAAALMLTVYNGIRVLFNLPMSRAIARAPLRKAMVGGAALLVLGGGAMAMSPTFPALLGARMVMGLGGSMFLLTTHLWLARLTTPQNRARLFSYHQIAGIVGMSLGPAISGGIAGWLSWRYSLIVTILASLVTIAIAPRLPLPAPEAADGTDSVGTGAPARIPAREIWGVGFCNLAFNVSFGGIVFTLVPLFAANALGMGPAAIGAIMMAGTAQRFGSAIIGGGVAARLGSRAVVFISLFGLGTAVLSFLFVSSPLGLLVAISILSWTNLGGSFVIAMITDRSPPSAWGTMFGMNRVFGDAGSMIAPVLVGWIVDRSGFAAAFAAMSLLILGSAAAGYVLTAANRSDAADPAAASEPAAP